MIYGWKALEEWNIFFKITFALKLIFVALKGQKGSQTGKFGAFLGGIGSLAPEAPGTPLKRTSHQNA